MAKKIKSSKEIDTGVEIHFEDGSSSFFKYGTEHDTLQEQYLKNPATGKFIGMSTQQFQEFGETFSDLGGYNPVSATDRFIAPQSTLPDLTNLNLGGEEEKGEEEVGSSDVFSDQTDFDQQRATFEEKAETESAAIRARVEKTEAAKRGLIMSRFEPIIGEAKEYQKDITEATKAQFATKRRLSTAATSFVDFQKTKAQKAINELTQKREDALAQLDITMADQIAEEISEWKKQEFEWMKYENDLKKVELDSFIKLGMYEITKAQAGREEESHLAGLIEADWNIIKDIPIGETVTIRGKDFVGISEEEQADPFFKGSDIISLMKALPEGTSQSITDPATGTEYLVTGLKEAGQDLVTFTDDKGNVTAFDKGTGAPLWTAAGVGKTKTRAPSTTIILRQSESDALAAAQAVLDGTRNQEGFYDPATYKAERLRFIQQTGNADLFDDQFQPHLDRKDEENIPFFTSAELELGGNTWTPEAEEMYINTFGLDAADIEAAKAAGIGPKDLLN